MAWSRYKRRTHRVRSLTQAVLANISASSWGAGRQVHSGHSSLLLPNPHHAAAVAGAGHACLLPLLSLSPPASLGLRLGARVLPQARRECRGGHQGVVGLQIIQAWRTGACLVGWRLGMRQQQHGGSWAKHHSAPTCREQDGSAVQNAGAGGAVPARGWGANGGQLGHRGGGWGGLHALVAGPDTEQGAHTQHSCRPPTLLAGLAVHGALDVLAHGLAVLAKAEQPAPLLLVPSLACRRVVGQGG